MINFSGCQKLGNIFCVYQYLLYYIAAVKKCQVWKHFDQFIESGHFGLFHARPITKWLREAGDPFDRLENDRDFQKKFQKILAEYIENPDHCPPPNGEADDLIPSDQDKLILAKLTNTLPDL